MPKTLPPHLVSSRTDAIKQCSTCAEEFRLDVKPSISKVFAKHVRDKHSKPTVAVKA